MNAHKFDQAILDSLPPLARGSHKDQDKAACAMEALARACGYGTTDAPECASPVIRAFVIAFNDDVLPSDELRDELIRPLIPLMVGTAGDGHDDERMYLCADRAVRVFAADALESAGLEHEAKVLRALGPVVDAQSAESAESAADSAARSAWSAWSAARSAAESAARLAARSAAESAARLAAWSAARSAWSAARSARAAAESAAWAAASAAAAAEGEEKNLTYRKAADLLRDLCEGGV